ncbi:MAG: hypothetical protein HYX80_04155 [Chloroflexi bacterium]|nr:hypothetical protein [Chloroflexota bacterium]
MPYQSTFKLSQFSGEITNPDSNHLPLIAIRVGFHLIICGCAIVRKD